MLTTLRIRRAVGKRMLVGEFRSSGDSTGNYGKSILGSFVNSL